MTRRFFIETCSPCHSKGRLRITHGLCAPCALGRKGLSADKREGDGRTPIGSWHFTHGFYRADRLRYPETALPIKAIRPTDGWCDNPADRNYNRQIRHPYSGSAEKLWREDHLYDLVIVLDYNVRPRIRGRGSAIFMHLTASLSCPTEGCVALTRKDLLRFIRHIRPGDRLSILR